MLADAPRQTMGRSAIEIARRGFHVFPCVPGEKRPLVPGGFHAATVDEKQLVDWWQRTPDANIGIATGHRSGIWALDVDVGAGKQGDRSLAALEEQHGSLPSTCRVRTPSGGSHIYFRCTEQDSIRSSAGSVGMHLDVRGDGGYVIAPPSVSSTGTCYSWDGSSDNQIARAPQWLTDLLKGGPHPPIQLAQSGSVIEGARNDTMFREGCKARRMGLCDDELAAYLHVVNESRCRPPLEYHEIDVIAASVSRYPVGAANDPAIDDDQQALELELGRMSDLQYGRARKDLAQREGVSVSVIDKLRKRGEQGLDGGTRAGTALLFAQVEPCTDPVAVSELLDEISATISRYVCCDKEVADAATLWIAHTWVYDHFPISPIALITAPEKRCGKTTLLTVMGRMVAKPMFASNITSAALFRSVEAYRPTLLIDEADTFFEKADELRGVINSGHTKDSAFVVRTVGDEHEPRLFSTWAPKVISMIKIPADTILDRSIVLTLRRKYTTEKICRLSALQEGPFPEIRSRLARFCADFDTLTTRAALAPAPAPDLGGLNDRTRDNWHPLLAIAALAGEEWPERAIKAAHATAGGGDDAPTISTELLADIRGLFQERGCEKIRSSDLALTLGMMEDKPWATFNRGMPIKPNQVARLLKPFKIGPATYKDEHNHSVKGYRQQDFVDVFTRYLPPLSATLGFNETEAVAVTGAAQ